MGLGTRETGPYSGGVDKPWSLREIEGPASCLAFVLDLFSLHFDESLNLPGSSVGRYLAEEIQSSW